MPIDEYYCQDCQKRFDIKASIQEREKGLKVKCPHCGNAKTIQAFGGFFTFSKGNSSNLGGCCGSNQKRGCGG